MTVTTSLTTIHIPASKASARQRLLNYLIFTLCASLYLLPFMRLLLLETDEGLLVSGAVRVMHGQVFARDFFEIVGPGTFYWVAMFFKLFGATFMAERICLFLTSLGTGLLVYFLSRRICTRYQTLPCIILIGTYFGALWPTISHHVDSNCFALLSVACLVIWQDRRKDSLLFAAGVLSGATTCFLQPKGVLLLFASVAWLWVQHRRRSAHLSSLSFLVSGYVSAVGLVLIYFWSHHALEDLIYANVLWPSMRYSAVNIVPYANGIVQYYWNGWVGPPGGSRWLVGLAIVLIGPFLLVAALPPVLVILGVLHRKKDTRQEVLLYWLCGWALWLSEIHRKDMCHLVFGSPLLIILCIHYIEEYRAKVADWVLQIISISAGCLAAFNLLLVLFAHPVPTKAGSVAVLKNDPVITALDNRVSPGEEIFVYPTYPMYYFLSGTTNPTRWSGLGYNYNSASELQEVVQVLDRRRVRHVVWDTLFQEKIKMVFPSMKPARSDQLIIEPYLESHYRVVWQENGVLIMERNP
jgi:4-amino-4-deoxy-L-arabinose transferase-like glycosyltransferase